MSTRRARSRLVRRVALIVLLPFLASGCAVGPDPSPHGVTDDEVEISLPFGREALFCISGFGAHTGNHPEGNLKHWVGFDGPTDIYAPAAGEVFAVRGDRLSIRHSPSIDSFFWDMDVDPAIEDGDLVEAGERIGRSMHCPECVPVPDVLEWGIYDGRFGDDFRLASRCAASYLNPEGAAWLSTFFDSLGSENPHYNRCEPALCNESIIDLPGEIVGVWFNEDHDPPPAGEVYFSVLSFLDCAEDTLLKYASAPVPGWVNPLEYEGVYAVAEAGEEDCPGDLPPGVRCVDFHVYYSPDPTLRGIFLLDAESDELRIAFSDTATPTDFSSGHTLNKDYFVYRQGRPDRP